MARNSSTRWYAALAVLVVFVLLAWLLGAVLTLTDGERVTLRVGLIVLGLLGAVALLWYLRPKDEGEQPVSSDKGDEVLPLVAAARSRVGRAVFDAKPLILVLGPEGSCKSTLVLRSGTDPELLAGDAPAGLEVAPKTRVANFWLVKDAVIAEAGSGTFNDVASWGRLVRALRSPRLAVAIGRGEAAPRAAVVCVTCDQLRSTDGAGQLDALAKAIRDRLTEAARAWGMAIPVYVVFTKADRISHFETWAAPLTRDEIQSVVGAALPFDETATAVASAAAKAAGTYAERMVPRVEGAVARLVSSLAGHRLALMEREAQGEQRLKAYELPRELGKIAPELSRFLVELCRPVHSGVSPQLRGFYFIGARPVTVEVPVAGSAPKVESSRAAASSATNVFTPQAIAAATSAAANAPGKTTTKRVPQWVFVERLFPDVFLADRGAAAMARGGVRVATVRRALFGAGIAAALVIAAGVTRSWVGNRALANRTADAARDVAALPVVSGAAAFPSADALRRLEGLRLVLDTLGQYQAAGVPGRLGWGLWVGDSLLAAGRRTWLEGYRRQLHDVAATALIDSLRALPVAPRPTDDYGRTYNWLKAYLLMSTESSKSTPEFLAPELIESWKRGAEIDADILALARPQFEYYATLLAERNPWPQDADMRIVGRTRVFLTGFSGSSQIYLNMITRAEKAAPPLKLAEAVPNLAGVMTAPAEVRGAFTKAGWEFMETAFKNSSEYFGSESWVVGDATAAKSMDQDAIIAELRARYRSEYVQQWRDVVRRSAVMQPSSIKDAARRLGAVSEPVSPLLGLVGVVSDNTDVDSLVRVAFQPTHLVVPPAPRDNLVNDGNGGYASALLGLRGALEGVDLVGAPVDSAAVEAIKQKAQEAMAQVILARTAARQLSQKFKSDTAAARLAPSVVALLESPVNGAEAALRGVARLRAPAVRAPVVASGGGGAPPAGGGGGGGGGDDKKKAAERAAQLNERGERICAAMAPMLGKFPFDPSATAEASVQEVTGLLAPGTGQLAAFQQEAMADLLEKQGNRWVAKPGKQPALSAPFVEFFNRAMTVSDALFDGAPTANVQFTALGLASQETPMIALTQGTQVAPFRVNTPPAVFVWPSTTGREARLSAQFGKNKEQLVARATGEWAIFRLVAQAASASGDGEITAKWNATGKGAKPIEMRFRAQSNAPIFKRGWLGQMSCVSQVAQ